ncbi:MAG: hypothetical protein NTW87_08955, partial [Planctomycetota bacterium]|nr:hypothetical protein [Planctomycetota bacterium]
MNVAWLGCIALAGACAADTDAKKPAANVIGWRGDGTGIFKDATPVLEWGRWPKSPNGGLRYQVRKPKAGDAGQNATPVRSGQILEWLIIGPFSPKEPA